MDRICVTLPAEFFATVQRAPTWSDAVRAGNQIFCTGQVGWDKKTGRMVEGGVEAQTRKALENLRDVLRRGGASLADVVMVRVYLLDREDHDRYDSVYKEFFPNDHPARVTVVVSDLIDKGSLIDIEATAIIR